MGKKSKRNRNNGGQNKQQPPPALRKNGKDNDDDEEETMENLKFQDPFVEPFNEEDDDDEVVEDKAAGNSGNKNAGKKMVLDDGNDEDVEIVQSWHPLSSQNDGNTAPDQLEMDPSAYKLYHALTPEWPCLSFDILKDDLGDGRTKFPHSLQAATGSQASQPGQNQLTILKLSDLCKMPQDDDDDDDDMLKDDDEGGDEDSDDDDDDDDVELDPIVEHYSIPHAGGINRVRAMPQQSDIVATWSDLGNVHLYNIESVRSRFLTGNSSSLPSTTPISSIKPFVTHSQHETEGYAMDWSRLQQGLLATGDCAGSIHVWNPRPEGGYDIHKSYDAECNNKLSIEDLQWSPTEKTVLASASCEGYVKIYDTRAPNKAMLSYQIHSNQADVNVMSWNALVTNLIATGGDDGTVSVWDLRHFGNTGSSKPAPLARFTSHKTPITSIEWHPTDESMLAVSDDVGTYIYDLSVEEDKDVATNTTVMDNSIPPQMLFVHCGSEQFKEIHWHPQISSCIMTTALGGFSVFIPSNL